MRERERDLDVCGETRRAPQGPWQPPPIPPPPPPEHGVGLWPRTGPAPLPSGVTLRFAPLDFNGCCCYLLHQLELASEKARLCRAQAGSTCCPSIVLLELGECQKLPLPSSGTFLPERMRQVGI